MKKLVSLLLVCVLALFLTACASSAGKDKVRVKCPACGYEFNAPAEP
jgi:PBP1b-binding outer membrane lipoprotein LpoB